MSTSKIIKAYITDLNGNRVTGAYVSDTVTALTYDGQTYTRNAQTGRSFAIAKDGDYFVAYLYNPDEAVSDGLVATFEGDLQWSDAPVLPTVSVTGDFGTNNWLYRTNGGTVMSIGANSQENLWNATGSGYVNVSYDTSKAYAVILWYFGTGSGDKGQNGVLSVSNNSGDIAAKNNTSSSVNLYALRCAVCSDSTATVVTVYNSSNVAYNAFKYTANNTDYYYVLDGTQTGWTDDLAGIGYSLTQTLDVYFFYALNQTTASPNAVQFNQNDYWFAYVIDSDDRTALQSFGVALTRQDSKYLVKGNNSQFAFEVLGLYSGVRIGDLSADLSNFYCETGSSGELQIRNHTAYTTNTATWKCRITKL